MQIPKPDPTKFSHISPDIVVLLNIAAGNRPRSAAQIAAALKALIPPEATRAALNDLERRGLVETAAKVLLTPAGAAAAAKELGHFAKKPWKDVLSYRLPMLALGIDASNAGLTTTFAKADAFKAALIAVSFGLPKDCMSSTKAAGGELVWRTLRASLSGLVGDGPFPAIAALATVERVILAGLAGKRPGARTGTITDILNDLAASGLGLATRSGIDGLRQQVILAGLRSAPDSDTGAKPQSGDTFPARVKRIAASLTTPPFPDRVAIAQVYDAFGRSESDAGSLASFKDRLISALAVRELSLARLDLPESLDRGLRERSETAVGTDVVHFVLR